MAMIQVCDKCGSPYQEDGFDHSIAMYPIKNNVKNTKKFDLCRNCQKELVDWISNKKAKVVVY